MAPIYIIFLQHRDVIQPPRHPNGPGTAIPVDERISLRTFTLLFVGTVSIFVLGVLYWKLGTFLRSFTRSRVTGGGRSAASHHVRAWYGWIPTMDYNYHKQRWKGEFRWVGKLMFWRSSHANYSWIWWDPDGEKSKQRAEDEGRLRRIPLRLMRYAINGLRPGPNSQPQVNAEKSPCTANVPAPQLNRSSLYRKRRDPGAMECEDFYLPHTSGSAFTISPRTRSKSLDDGKYGLRYTSRLRPIARRTLSEGHQGSSRHIQFHYSSTQPMHTTRRYGRSSMFSYENSMDEIPAAKSLSWKYRAWGARMQCQTFGDINRALRGHAGRPGTAMSFAIRSMISSGSGSGSEVYQSLHADIRQRPVPSSTKPCDTFSIHPSCPPWIQVNESSPQHLSHTEDTSSVSRLHGQSYSGRIHMSSSRYRPGENALRIRKRRGIRRRLPLENCLSRPEVRLVDDLDRKLEWLSNEMDPGRKSFAFLLLHNHWLNRATWVVTDPSSRITVQKKRIRGDPRVNTMAFGGNGKAAVLENTPAPRVRAVTPRIDSWRVAVNRARASSGAKEIKRVAELFEGSAEEAADNNVDPASWILKKPQQGNGMSNKQKEAYFEGPGGWCEKLDYWENVPRLYRVRRVVFQGKANRRCVVRTSKDICGGVEKATQKAKRLGVEQYARIKQFERSEKSGRGVVGPRHSPRSTLPRSVVNIQMEDPAQGLQNTPDLVSMQERDEG
ncbi:hypothetical protein MauCBS54593_005594 [Microsporum audouinii]